MEALLNEANTFPVAFEEVSRLQELVDSADVWSEMVRAAALRYPLVYMSMKVEDVETTDTFIVSGRGTVLHVKIENMRREDYEFMIGPPKVINRQVNGKKLEPFEFWPEHKLFIGMLTKSASKADVMAAFLP